MSIVLRATAALAAITVIVRACVQAITVDEAVSYTTFARLPNFDLWKAHSNNHVLNSLLMRLFTSVFGTSHLTVRGGAVIGAAIFIYAVYRLTKSIAGESILAWALFTCFVFNPFILDFLVAARGYSLALAFLALAVAIAFGAVGRAPWSATGLEPKAEERVGREPGGPPYRECALVSICLALSFSANFAFGVVDAVAWLALFIWMANAPAIRKLTGKGRSRVRAQLLAMAVLPGLLVATYIVGGALLHWRDVSLGYGVTSLRDCLRSLVEASLYQVNPMVVSPIFLGMIRRNAHHILPLLAIFCTWRIIAIVRERAMTRDRHSRRLLAICLTAVFIMAIALTGHEILFHAFGVNLPQDRTAIYLVFLLTLAIGALASIPLKSLNGRLSGRALTAGLLAAAVYFLSCYRIGYFKEWEFDRDIDQVYSVIAYYNHTCGIRDAGVNWRYDAPLNYYRIVSRRETFSVFKGSDHDYPDGQRLYVLNDWDDAAYIKAKALKVAWKSPAGVTVALDPALDNGRPCVAPLADYGVRP
jgi:uncharacterized membrane protein